MSETCQSQAREGVDRNNRLLARQKGKLLRRNDEGMAAAKHSATFLLCFVFCCCLGLSYAVIGIDFGSKWIKMSVIRGNEFAVILDAASQRKTTNTVSFERGERFFGPDAERLVIFLHYRSVALIYLTVFFSSANY